MWAPFEDILRSRSWEWDSNSSTQSPALPPTLRLQSCLYPPARYPTEPISPLPAAIPSFHPSALCPNQMLLGLFLVFHDSLSKQRAGLEAVESGYLQSPTQLYCCAPRASTEQGLNNPSSSPEGLRKLLVQIPPLSDESQALAGVRPP